MALKIRKVQTWNKKKQVVYWYHTAKIRKREATKLMGSIS